MVLKDSPLFGGLLILFGALVSYKESAQFIMKLFQKEDSEGVGTNQNAGDNSPQAHTSGQGNKVNQKTYYIYGADAKKVKELEERINKLEKVVQVKDEDESIDLTIREEDNQNGK